VQNISLVLDCTPHHPPKFPGCLQTESCQVLVEAHPPNLISFSCKQHVLSVRRSKSRYGRAITTKRVLEEVSRHTRCPMTHVWTLEFSKCTSYATVILRERRGKDFRDRSRSSTEQARDVHSDRIICIDCTKLMCMSSRCC
jgi:hypothetical protein